MLPQNMHLGLLTISSWRNVRKNETSEDVLTFLKLLSGEVPSRCQRRGVSMPPRSQGCERKLNTRTRCCPFPALSHFPKGLSTLHQIHTGWNTSALTSSQRFLCCVKLTLNTLVCFAVVNLFLLLFFRGPSRQLGRIEEKSIFPLLQLQINIHLESALSLAGVEDRFSSKQETNT